MKSTTKIIFKLSFIFIYIFLTNSIFSQNTLYIGTVRYSATNWWSFLNAGKYESWLPNSTLSVCLVKSTPNGKIVLSAKTMSSEQSIGGIIMIYMKDGSVISLSNRINNDHADEESIVIYSINSAQLSNLKKNDILKIRYSIIGPYNIKESYTAENRYNTSTQLGIYDERTHNTAQEITELIDK